MTVVDASVAVKWFLEEPYSEEAIQLTTMDRDLVGPTLAQYEVAGAFIRALRRGDIDADTASMLCHDWLQSVATNVMRLEGDNRDIVRGSEIAEGLDHPLADCIYLAMAERLACPLITADRPFCEKAGREFDRVVFIDEVMRLAA